MRQHRIKERRHASDIGVASFISACLSCVEVGEDQSFSVGAFLFLLLFPALLYESGRRRDEGAGPIILFVHGAVGWSFLYRNIIKDLRSDFRCVAIDWPGFGLSDATPDFETTLPGNSRILETFIQELGLTDKAHQEQRLFEHLQQEMR